MQGDCCGKQDDLCPGAPRPQSAARLTAAGAHGEGLHFVLGHRSPASPQQLFSTLNLQEALPNSCANSCHQRVGPEPPATPPPTHPALPLGSWAGLTPLRGAGGTMRLQEGWGKASARLKSPLSRHQPGHLWAVLYPIFPASALQTRGADVPLPTKMSRRPRKQTRRSLPAPV